MSRESSTANPEAQSSTPSSGSKAAAVVRKKRLELSRLAALEPKSSASTSSATFASGDHGDR